MEAAGLLRITEQDSSQEEVIAMRIFEGATAGILAIAAQVLVVATVLI